MPWWSFCRKARDTLAFNAKVPRASWHDPIPEAEELQGECLMWWTRWIANIEKAVKKRAELQV